MSDTTFKISLIFSDPKLRNPTIDYEKIVSVMIYGGLPKTI